MIAVQNLVKYFRVDGRLVKAVDNVTFTCKRGEYLAVIGHSGSGKSTLLSLIGGLTKPDSGEIIIDETDLLSLDDGTLSQFRSKKINFIFQFASLLPTLTALENVMLPVLLGSMQSSRQADMRNSAEYLLNIVGLGDKLNAYPSQLSGGQQRRVAIARAFINNPEIILADEPTGDLDEETESEMMKIFKQMNREKEITFVVVTHSSVFADEADRIFRMHNGGLEEINSLSKNGN